MGRAGRVSVVLCHENVHAAGVHDDRVALTVAVPEASLLRDLATLGADPIPCCSILVGAAGATSPAETRKITAVSPLLAERYDARPGTVYLFRPDQHVCARWRGLDLTQTRAGIGHATGQYVH